MSIHLVAQFPNHPGLGVNWVSEFNISSYIATVHNLRRAPVRMQISFRTMVKEGWLLVTVHIPATDHCAREALRSRHRASVVSESEIRLKPSLNILVRSKLKGNRKNIKKIRYDTSIIHTLYVPTYSNLPIGSV